MSMPDLFKYLIVGLWLIVTFHMCCLSIGCMLIPGTIARLVSVGNSENITAYETAEQVVTLFGPFMLLLMFLHIGLRVNFPLASVYIQTLYTMLVYMVLTLRYVYYVYIVHSNDYTTILVTVYRLFILLFFHIGIKC